MKRLALLVVAALFTSLLHSSLHRLLQQLKLRRVKSQQPPQKKRKLTRFVVRQRSRPLRIHFAFHRQTPFSNVVLVPSLSRQIVAISSFRHSLGRRQSPSQCFQLCRRQSPSQCFQLSLMVVFTIELSAIALRRKVFLFYSAVIPQQKAPVDLTLDMAMKIFR